MPAPFNGTRDPLAPHEYGGATDVHGCNFAREDDMSIVVFRLRGEELAMFPHNKVHCSARALRDITNRLHDTLTLAEADDKQVHGIIPIHHAGHLSCSSSVFSDTRHSSSTLPEVSCTAPASYGDSKRKDHLLSRISMAHPPSGKLLIHLRDQVSCVGSAIVARQNIIIVIIVAGPRKLHEGTAEMEHRVLKVLDDPQNSFTEMHVTLLAAGFVIGPSGQSVRAICEKSGAHIQSSTRSGVQGPHRLFAIVGSDKCRASAQHIIESAVNLYQQLFRGLGPALIL